MKSMFVAMAIFAALLMATPSWTQSGSFTQTYCITGVSTGVSYSWHIDLGDDGVLLSPQEPDNTHSAPVPRGSQSAALAAALAADIQTAACNSPGVCTGGTCTAGDPSLIGTACTTHSSCTTEPPVCVQVSAADRCLTVSAMIPFSLYVGPPDIGVNCEVTKKGCRYNPIIRLQTP